MGSVADLDPQSAAENAVSVIGHGYDLCKDIRFSSCKSERLIEIDLKQMRDVIFPGGVVVSGVPSSIKCDKGERTSALPSPGDEWPSLSLYRQTYK
ncbi:hypothetical protein K1719_046782 [Acacia pycnantha]|nr:hypothetical protein K1719_046782 [Acacia pycnantha]